jgi:hypothetical protein
MGTTFTVPWPTTSWVLSAREVERMPEAQTSGREALRALAAHLTERFQRGESAESVRADLVARGLNPEAVDALLAGFAPSAWERGAGGRTLRVAGLAIFFAGWVLGLGNQFDILPTFPFAGTLVALLGAGLYVVGGGKW